MRRSAGGIGAAFLEDGIDAVQQLSAGGDEGGFVGLALGELLVEVRAQVRVAQLGAVGGQVEGAAQIGAATFGQVRPAGGELATAVDAEVDRGVGDQGLLLGGRGTGGVAELGQEAGGKGGAEAGQGGEVLADAAGASASIRAISCSVAAICPSRQAIWSSRACSSNWATMPRRGRPSESCAAVWTAWAVAAPSWPRPPDSRRIGADAGVWRWLVVCEAVNLVGWHWIGRCRTKREAT